MSVQEKQGNENGGDTGSRGTINGDQIQVGDIEGVGIAIGTGASVRIYGDVHYYPIKLQAPLREEFDPLIENRVGLFAGRELVLDEIAGFIQRPAGGYLVITAPAGFGKTALMAALVHSTPEAFAYHFFSPEYGGEGLKERFFLRNTVQQMAQWHEHKGEVPQDLNELRALYQQMIDEPLERTQVLVLDGLDEVQTWDLSPYVSRHLPDHLHIIVTLRETVDQWQSRYRIPEKQRQRFRLDGLDRDGVTSLLRSAGGPAVAMAEDPLLVDKIVNVAVYEDDRRRGVDPFFIRLVAEDIADGRITEDILANQPTGLNNYLDGWWEEMKRSAGDTPSRDLFGSLTAALGPIGRIDLEAVNPSLVDEWTKDFFDDVLKKVRRFVMGDDERGYLLVHPRLRQYLRTKIRVEMYVERLLVYCREWAKHQSPYALTYYARHLAESGSKAQLYRLIDTPWQDLKFEQLKSYQGFAEDVALAIQAARNEDPPNIFQSLRNCLVYRSIAIRAGGISEYIHGALALLDRVAEAQEWAGLIEANRHQSDAFRLIGEALFAGGKVEAGRQNLMLAIQAAEKIESRNGQLAAFMRIARTLGLAGECQLSRQIADQALKRVAAITDRVPHPMHLSYVAWAWVDAGDVENATMAAEAAWKVTISGNWQGEQKVWTDYEVITRASFATVVAGNKGYWKYEPAGWITEVLASVGSPVAADIARDVPDSYWAAHSLATVARLTAQAGETTEARELIEEARIASTKIVDEGWKAQALSEIVKALVSAGDHREATELAEEALRQARAIEDEIWRGVAVNSVAPALIRLGDYDQALEITSGEIDPFALYDMLLEAAPSLAQAGQTGKLRDIVEAKGDTAVLSGIAAWALARAGDKENAARLANRALSKVQAKSYIGVDTLCAIGEALLQLKANSKAENVLNRALATAERSRNRDGDLRLLAPVFARTGEQDTALNIVESIEDEYQKAYALRSVVLAFAHSSIIDHIEHALNISFTCTSTNEQSIALSGIAEAMMRAGNAENARLLLARTASSIQSEMKDTSKLEYSNGAMPVEALYFTIQALARCGLEEEAINLVELIPDLESWIDALCAVARVLIEKEEHKSSARDFVHLAQTEMKAIDDPNRRAEGVRKIVPLLMKLGDRELALEIVRGEMAKIPASSGMRGSIQSELVQALAQTGEYREAVNAARQIEEADYYSIAFCGLIGILAEAGRQDLVAEAWRYLFEQAYLNRWWDVSKIVGETAGAIAATDQGETLWRLYEMFVEQMDS